MHSQVTTKSSKFSGLGDPISLQFRSSDALLRNLTRLVENVISELLILTYFFHLFHFTAHSFGKQARLPVSLFSRSPSETGHFFLVYIYSPIKHQSHSSVCYIGCWKNTAAKKATCSQSQK